MEGFCNACLTKYEDPSELLYYSEMNRRLYLYCTGIQIKPNDVLPFQICQTCFTKMKMACKFKKQCRTSEKRLNNYLSLKEAGEQIDFSTYLQNTTEGPLLFRFPVIGNSTPSLNKTREDDNVSTSTSIRNFMTDFLREDEIPDTEARMIREMIEQEADMLDDSLDSQWLQDDISIASDFRFSPYSTPLSKINSKPLDYSPIKGKPQEQLDQKEDRPESTGRKNILAAKKLLLSSDSSVSECETSSLTNSLQSCNTQNFIASKKILLKSKSSSDKTSKHINQESYLAAKRILLNSKSKSNENNDELETNQEQDIDLETYMATKSILLNSNPIDDDKPKSSRTPLSDIIPNYDVAESVTYDSIDENECTSITKGFYVENIETNDNEVGIRIIGDDKKDCIERNIEKALNNTNDEVISLSALLASPSNESVSCATPHNNIIATPSVHQGLSGANTPTIANILFGEIMDNEDNQPVDKQTANSEASSEVDVLKDFFNKSTGEYIGEVKRDPDDIFEEYNQYPKSDELKPGKCKFDLTDFSCKKCNVRYKSERGLKIHFAKTHNMKIICQRQKEPRVEMPCDQCGRIFNLKSNLSRHIRVMHKATKAVNKCKVCFLEFGSESRLKIHLKSHTGVKHTKKQDNENLNLMCNICGHISTQASNLKTHMARHNKTYSFTCEPCGRGFYRKTDLQIHMRIHMDVKPFRCSQCSESFRRKDQLQTHWKRHAGERSFTCTICENTFATSANLRNHMKISKKCQKMKIRADLEANRIIEEKIDQFFKAKTPVSCTDVEDRLTTIEEQSETLNTLDTHATLDALEDNCEKSQEFEKTPGKITEYPDKLLVKVKEVNADIEMTDLTLRNSTSNKSPPQTLDDDRVSISDMFTIPFLIETDKNV